MRETYSTLLQQCKDFCIDDETSTTSGLSASSSFLSRQINNTIQYLFQEIRNYKSQPLPKTMNTVEDQTYYHNPPNLLSIESITLEIGEIDYPLTVINSQSEWDRLQQVDITSSTIPLYYFPRQSDFGIYPTPTEDDLTVTLVGNFLPSRLSVVDDSTGTVSVTQDSITVTGVGTAFTSAMIGRWFCEADSNGLAVGNWYRVTSYASTTSIELESVFEETSLSGSSYIIAQSPEIPEELHQYIPYRAAASYYATIRRDPTQAQRLMNYFYTGDYFNPNRGGGIKGGVLGIINRYKNTGRGNSQIANLHKSRSGGRSEAWTVELTE